KLDERLLRRRERCLLRLDLLAKVLEGLDVDGGPSLQTSERGLHLGECGLVLLDLRAEPLEVVDGGRGRAGRLVLQLDREGCRCVRHVSSPSSTPTELIAARGAPAK